MKVQNLEGCLEVIVGGHNINNLRYTDGPVSIAQNKEDLQQLLDIVERENRKKGLELNSKKTEVIGSLISSHGHNFTKIASRLAKAKKSFQRMKSIVTN